MELRGHVLLAPLCLLLMHCGGDSDAAAGGGTGGTNTTSGSAKIETRVASASAGAGGTVLKFKGGAAQGGGLESLKYHINSISICETLEPSGSGFNNPGGCLELYRGDEAGYTYRIGDDYAPQTERARASDTGFVDLLSESSRRTLSGATVLTEEHVRSYHYGVITWALPIKLKATVRLSDGSSLYTHDGRTGYETVGADMFRAYFTAPSMSLRSAPAEEAVVLLPNGGNWFKFQTPFTITTADIADRRAFVLDLVFNPDGIVKGFVDSYAGGSLSERAPDAGMSPHVADITVPMLDLAPVPHRADERVMRESYQGRIALGGNSFDLRVELYYVDGDPNNTVYGVDVKSLVNGETTDVPPEVMKVAFLDRESDGTLTLLSFKRSPLVRKLARVTGTSGTTRVEIACATHADRAGAEGGAAIVVERCPSPQIEVTLALTGRSAVTGGVETAVGGGIDAGTDASTGSMVITIGGIDAGR